MHLPSSLIISLSLHINLTMDKFISKQSGSIPHKQICQSQPLIDSSITMPIGKAIIDKQLTKHPLTLLRAPSLVMSPKRIDHEDITRYHQTCLHLIVLHLLRAPFLIKPLRWHRRSPESSSHYLTRYWICYMPPSTQR